MVEGETSGSNLDNINDQSNEFHDVTNNISDARGVSEVDDVFEDAPLDFDPAYPPMDNCTHNH